MTSRDLDLVKALGELPVQMTLYPVIREARKRLLFHHNDTNSHVQKLQRENLRLHTSNRILNQKNGAYISLIVAYMRVVAKVKRQVRNKDCAKWVPVKTIEKMQHFHQMKMLTLKANKISPEEIDFNFDEEEVTDDES